MPPVEMRLNMYLCFYNPVVHFSSRLRQASQSLLHPTSMPLQQSEEDFTSHWAASSCCQSFFLIPSFVQKQKVHFNPCVITGVQVDMRCLRSYMLGRKLSLILTETICTEYNSYVNSTVGKEIVAIVQWSRTQSMLQRLCTPAEMELRIIMCCCNLCRWSWFC